MVRPRKPSHRRVDNRSERGREVVPLEVLKDVDPPKPPPGLLKETVEWWEQFWGSDLAVAATAPTDVAALERLATLIDQRTRFQRAGMKEAVVAGSKGQPILNPLLRQVPTLDAEIRQLEDRFGLSPKARVNLGVSVEAYRKTIADLTTSGEAVEIADYMDDDQEGQ